MLKECGACKNEKRHARRPDSPPASRVSLQHTRYEPWSSPWALTSPLHKWVEHRQGRRERLESGRARVRIFKAGQSQCGVDVRTSILLPVQMQSHSQSPRYPSAGKRWRGLWERDLFQMTNLTTRQSARLQSGKHCRKFRPKPISWAC